MELDAVGADLRPGRQTDGQQLCEGSCFLNEAGGEAIAWGGGGGGKLSAELHVTYHSPITRVCISLCAKEENEI